MSEYDRVTMKSFLSPDGNEYFYAVVGDPKNHVLVLLPGFTGTHSDLIPLASYLKDTYFIIIPDLPGWGKSPRFKAKLTLANYAMFLHSLLEHLKVKQMYLFGHCMGATLALEFALCYPHMAKKIIVVSTPYNEGLLSQRLFLHLAEMSAHTPKFFRPLLFFWRSRVFSIPLSFFVLKFRSFRKVVRVTLSNMTKQSHHHEDVVEENWVSLVQFDYDRVKALRLPVYIIHGEKDVLINPKQAVKLYELLPHASLQLINESGHLPPVETPGTLATLIKGFLEE